MGEKPVPAVPDRILALTTPPFPSAIANPLTADAKLQAALDAAIKAGPGTSWRVPVAIVALSASGARPVAHFKGTDVYFSASLLKVSAMYTAFELRKTIRAIGVELGAKTTKAELLKDAARYLDPKILAKAASLPALKGVKKVNAVPQYATTFDVVPSTSGTGFSVEFSKSFLKHLDLMISISDNGSAGQCVHGSGYGYLNGTLAEAGFFKPGTNNGIWLAGDYTGTYPKFRINSINDGPVAQATTCLDLARMYTLINDGKLVDKPACSEMLALLARAVEEREIFINRATGLNFTVTHTKVGLAGLKPENGGQDVCSEGSILERSAGQRFVAVWQNFPFPKNDDFSEVALVVQRTMDAFLKP
jgi:hypothetical protein